MRIKGAWLSAEATQTVLDLLVSHGHQAYCVGGCVRNAVIGQPVADIDIATDALPDRVMELAGTAGLHAIPTGIEHGTVTVVASGEPYEITTFRADVETDGRRAVVRYSDSLEEDARRRDFTMNALYARADGSIVDPLGGLADAVARRVVFIDDADARIREDYLRILRFFRFTAWYGDPGNGFDADTLAAIAGNLDGLSRLSAERVGAEMVRFLSAPDPVQAVSVMAQVGVLSRILPGADPRALGPLVLFENGAAPDPMRRLAALGVFDGTALRLSRADQKQLALYQTLISSEDGAAALGYRHGADLARDGLVLRAAMTDTAPSPADLAAAEQGAQARFPVTARDLMPTYQGPALGDRLRTLEERWIASGFSLTREDLLG